MKDERHWPAAMQEKRGDQNTGLSLEKLNLQLTANVYALQPGQPLLVWGPTWTRHKTYTTIDAIQRELSFDQQTVLTDLPFADPLAHDYRLPPSNSAIHLNCLPQGDVPQFRVGSIRARQSLSIEGHTR